MAEEDSELAELVRDIRIADAKFRDDPQMMAMLVLIDAVAKRAHVRLDLVSDDMHVFGIHSHQERKDLGCACLALATTVQKWAGIPPLADAELAARLRREQADEAIRRRRFTVVPADNVP